jgi:hypothetical protein
MNGTVTRADFDKESLDGKLGLIFETLQTREEKCGERFDGLEKRKTVNTAMAAGGGFVGGVTAIIAYIKLFLPIGKG